MYHVLIKGYQIEMTSAENPKDAIEYVAGKLFPNCKISIFTPSTQEERSKCNCKVSLVGGVRKSENMYLVQTQKLNKFDIPVEWSNYGKVRVFAETLEDAVKIIQDKFDELPLASAVKIDSDGTVSKIRGVGEYLEGSYHIEGDTDNNMTVKQLAEYLDGII